ncbi:MAG: HAMP domain-containing protein, partial [Bacillota bacterium]|nr:HAMP domain-containing protein [Bacillota bacterium]
MRKVRLGIQGKLAAALFLLALLTMQFVGVFLLRSMEEYFLRQVRTDLRTTASMVAGVVAGSLTRQPPALEDAERFIRNYSSSLSAPSWQGRLVLVDPEEVVLASSSADVVPGQAFRRPEIRSGALKGEVTEGQYSEGDTTFYTVAVPVQGLGRILGAIYLDAPLGGVDATLASLRQILVTATILAVLILTLLGLVVARAITRPLQTLTAQAAAMARGDFRQVLSPPAADELGILADTFNYLSQRLQDTLQAISDEKQRAEAILTYMADGMVALDSQGRVLMINPAAARLLAVRPVDAQGKPLAQLWPDEGVQEALAESLAGSLASVQTRVSHPPRTLHARLAPLKVGDQVSGVVMVMRDVTEQEKVEAMRQEFVADVSHELKTP